MASGCDDDYMSSIFIQEDDNKQNRATKRSSMTKCKKNKSKRSKIVIEESKLRQEGLNQPLNDGNVGYQMLHRMGYEPGRGLGRSGTGIVQPISVEVKNDRVGMGRNEFVKNKLETERKLKEKDENLFHERQKYIHEAKQLHSDLVKCQSACEQLDKTNNIEDPRYHWFWKSTDTIIDEDNTEIPEDDEIIYSDEEKLLILVSYLRDNYHYCPWCGHRYTDQDEMTRNCPGKTSNDHD